MVDQPDAPVNPYERGLLLPPGCKDLIDAMARVRKAEGFESSIFCSGGLSEIHSYFGRLYTKKTALPVLAIVSTEKEVFLTISGVNAFYELAFFYRRGNKFLENAISELFDERDVWSMPYEGGPLFPGDLFVKITLPGDREVAAQRIIDLLVLGFGLQEKTRLHFCLDERSSFR